MAWWRTLGDLDLPGGWRPAMHLNFSRRGGEIFFFRRGSIRNKITWVQQRQHYGTEESARERMLSFALILGWGKSNFAFPNRWL